jgi:Gas vesicle protein G
MGLIKEIVLLPFAPVRGTVWVAERIADEVEREQYGPENAVKKLDRIEEAKKRGELDEPEADKRQEEVIEQQVVKT